MIKNAKGTVYYGLHFYSGVAQYSEAGKDPFRVFLNEDTLRSMDASFSGRPVFVMHVEGVEQDLDILRGEADGWVVESFYNAHDGKHWCKFIVCSERGEKAVAQGMKLSNCYLPTKFGKGGLWNGVPYTKEIEGGEYEHLAIVPNPRYEESIILTPEEFKAYNESKKTELAKIANQGEPMKFKFFKRAKVENSIDLEETMVELPKSKREVSISTLINEMDDHEEKKPKAGEAQMANEEHHVELGEGKKMSVKELKDCYNALVAEHSKVKDEGEEENDLGSKESKDPGNDDEEKNSEDDVEAKGDAKKLVAHEEKEIEAEKKKNAKEKADRLRNANKRALENDDASYDPFEKLSRGKARYGSK